MADSPKPRKPAPPGFRWVFRKRVKHWRSLKMMERKDGGYFAFLVRC